MNRSKPTSALLISLSVLAVLAVMAGTACAQQAASGQQMEESDPDVLAVVNGVKIMRSEVEKKAADAFESLRVERLQFEAEQKQKRHDVVLRHLEEMVADRVLELEAQAQGMEQQELLETQVFNKVAEPAEEEIEQVYEINKSRLRQPLEAVRPQIINFLQGRQRENLLQQYIEELKVKYDVSQSVQPFRYDIEHQGHPSKGPEDAPVVLVEFSDFECPYCTRMNDTLNVITEKYGDKVMRVFRQFPLNSIHPNAQRAAEASLCAFEQGKFWEMHGRLFERPAALSVDAISEKAVDIGLDQTEFQACLTSGRHADVVEADMQDGRIAGVSGTPALFINGRPVRGAASADQVSDLIDEEIKRQGRQ
ncbi:MAG TPA: thioredoxin domain-containing protein [Acidobacteriota bacterium]|nr:thioredoxin domain-containing protein [Acidobacteriota bacterium]